MKKNYLNTKKCSACNGDTAKLSKSEIINHLNLLDDWSLNDEKKMIFKKIKFKTFKQALNFTNIVGEIAEHEGHHPDISLGWGYCLLLIHTHAIQGLSVNDFILASKIDQIKI